MSTISSSQKRSHTLGYVTVAIESLGLMALGANLAFVPKWWIARPVIIAIGTASALACIAGVAISKWRNGQSTHRWRLTVGVLVAVVFTLGIAYFVVFTSFPETFYNGEKLVETVEDPAGRRTLFVYGMEDLLDGPVGTRVAVGERWSVLERTLLDVRAPLAGVHQEGDEVLVVFYGAGAARYNFTRGEVLRLEHWSEKSKPRSLLTSTSDAAVCFTADDARQVVLEARSFAEQAREFLFTKS
jgi:hypothetical protein